MASGGLLQAAIALEESQALEAEFLTADAPHPWSLERDLLAGKDQVALLGPPAPGLPIPLVLVAPAGKLLDLLIDEGLHDEDPGLRCDSLDRVADPGEDLRDRQAQLNALMLAIDALHPASRLDGLSPGPTGGPRALLLHGGSFR